MKKLILIWMMALLCFSGIGLAYLDSGHISLLTVAESGDNASTERGGVADLYLAIKPGTGRIFIDSFPISKEDTQITTRFAEEMACDFLDVDCSHYDFFYTISAESSIVGGPSAGAAATVLTASMLDNQRLDDKTVMTGTINSGYLVGPVAGIEQKTLAAQNFGFTKVLIPKWDSANQTFNPGLHINVVRVSTLEDALYEFTGKNYSKDVPIDINSDKYTAIMKQVTIDLCSKYGSVDNGVIIMPNLTKILNQNIPNITINESGNITGDDFFIKAKEAIDNKQYYSAASFCFGGNVVVASQLMNNLTGNELKKDYADLLGKISVFDQKLDERADNLSTISELETYMVVKERISEAQDTLSSINPENISSNQLAYASERFSTANIWSRFFDLPGAKFVMDNNALKVVCSKKLSEAEERINYVELYFPNSVDRSDLNNAYGYYDNKDYALCIFTASKSKADADTILSAIFVSNSSISQLIDDKLAAARKVIARQESTDVFPILGYSYYEYSRTLNETSPYSSLVYAEYALELSNLNMYFPKQQQALFINPGIPINMPMFFAGFAVGIIFVIIISFIFGKRKVNGEKEKKVKRKNSRKR